MLIIRNLLVSSFWCIGPNSSGFFTVQLKQPSSMHGKLFVACDFPSDDLSNWPEADSHLYKPWFVFPCPLFPHQSFHCVLMFFDFGKHFKVSKGLSTHGSLWEFKTFPLLVLVLFFCYSNDVVLSERKQRFKQLKQPKIALQKILV